MTAFLLLPSPLLGASGTWLPVAAALRGRGHTAHAARVPAGASAPATVLGGFTWQAREQRPDVLVVHSNAGYYAPQVAAGCDAGAVVYVDAALPKGDGRTVLADDAMREFLAGLADADGVLPPWTRWWPEEQLAGVFPSDAWRRRVEAAQPRMPLSWFDGTVPVAAGWRDRPSGYLAFGSTYATELARADGFGWPTRQLAGGHLHQIHDPGAVAEAIEQLVGELAA